MKRIYLDYAAASPLDPSVLKAMLPYLGQKYFNPSATYSDAVNVRKDIQVARSSIAKQFGSKPAEIVFTAGATEANNLAIHGIMSQYPNANIVVSAIEHESVLTPAKTYKFKIADVNDQGLVNLEDLAKKIDQNTVLVSIIYANNEIGAIQPLSKIAALLNEIRKSRAKSGNKLPLYFHTDAAQAPAYLDIHASRLGVDLMSINGGKIYGPKQSGALFVKAGIILKPQILGGGQERGLRSGTENVAGIVGLSVALDLVQSRRSTEVKRLQALQHQFIADLKKVIPEIIINGSLKQRLPNNVHITIPGIDNERLIIQLDQAGILSAAGSACSASDEAPSHVLMAMGISREAAQSSLRFSIGHQTTKAEIKKTVQILAKLAKT